jgi:hypothetical protein
VGDTAARRERETGTSRLGGVSKAFVGIYRHQSPGSASRREAAGEKWRRQVLLFSVESMGSSDYVSWLRRAGYSKARQRRHLVHSGGRMQVDRTS